MLKHTNILFSLKAGFDPAFVRLAFRLKAPLVHLHGNEAFLAGIKEYNPEITESLPHHLIDYDFIIADLSDLVCVETVREFSKSFTVVIHAEYFTVNDPGYLERLMTESLTGLSEEVNRDTLDSLKKALHNVSLIQIQATLQIAQKVADLENLVSATKLLFK